MFASKTPRDLNHDPEPWENENGERYDRHPQHVGHGAFLPVMAHEPRPEFDHVQHNAPNPILVAFRRDPRRDQARAWLRIIGGPDKHFTTAEKNHARRVLERLARFTP